jgi:ankyrin repeat protein
VIVVQRIDIEQARKRAKELLRAWRAEARPEAKLADAQRQVARDLGFGDWPALHRHAQAAAVERGERRAALVDWATNGRAEHAQALLDVDPGLARAGLDAALVTGTVDVVAAALQRDPGAAGRETGARNWAPLVYVTHSAFLGGERTDNLLACAVALLDAGADPDAAWRHPEFGALSALYGAAGVAHEPRMTALLLDRGANPDDGESLYHACEDRSGRCLELLLDAGARVAGTNAVPHMLDRDDVERLRLLLARGSAQEGGLDLGGTIAAALARGRSRAHIEALLAHGAPVAPGDATLAVRRGRPDVLDLLGEPDPSPADGLLGALRRADRDGAEAVLAAHPGLLDGLGRGDHDVLVNVAAAGDLRATELMLDLGFPVDVSSEDFEETPLHAAAWYGRADVASLLLARGADPDAPAGPPFGGTPLDWAARGSRDADAEAVGEAGVVDHPATVRRLLAAGAALSSPEVAQAASAEVAPLLA